MGGLENLHILSRAFPTPKTKKAPDRSRGREVRFLVAARGPRRCGACPHFIGRRERLLETIKKAAT